MARALQDILTELNSVYNPQRDVYNAQLSSVDPQLEAEQKGLQAQKEDAFGQITQQANRRGLFYSGLPIQEEQRYTGSQFLPAVANLRAKYAQQRFGLQEALAKITQEQGNRAQDIYQTELNRDLQQKLADEEAARARAATAAGAAQGFVPTGGNRPQAPIAVNTGTGQSLRQRWQEEAKRGDWNAQVALNYAGDDGRYDGPVNSQDEYNRLKSMGINGNYYVRGGANAVQRGGGGGGF